MLTNNISIVADDFGITKKVNESIIDLIINKKITDTSCIVVSENFKDSCKDLSNLSMRFGKGIHLTLTDFISLTSPKNISKNGKFLSFRELFIKIYKGNILEEEIENEINCQLDLFEQLMGSKPDFIDGHHHVHQLPKIRTAVFKVLKKRYSNDLPCIRNTHEKKLKILKRKVCITKTLLLSFYGYSLKKEANKYHFKTNNGFSGIYNFSEDINFRDLFVKFTKYIDNNHLLMVHPGESDHFLEKIDPVTLTRNYEKSFLLNSEFSEILDAQSLSLEPFHLTFLKSL